MNRHLLALLCSAAIGLQAVAGECYARLQNDTLRIGNSKIERTWLWNNGDLVTLSVTDKASGRTFRTAGNAPDFVVNRAKASGGRFQTAVLPSDGIRPERMVATVSYRLGDGLEVERTFRVYPKVASIATDTRLRGNLNGIATAGDVSAADRSNIEHTEDMAVKPVTALLDRLKLNGNHWHGHAVEFRDITDWNNNLLETSDFISYRKTNHRGNILMVSDGEGDGGFIFLKEAPCSSVQLAYKGADFITDFADFMVTGMGISEADVKPDKWTTTYSTVLCTFGDGELSALQSLRDYQKQVRILDPSRDEMVMMNTWGDRSQDAKVNEAFCLAELEKASRLGISLFQIDDGWQAGKSPNSAVAKGSFKDIHRNADYWSPDTAKYPRGLTPIVKRGRELGIEIGLWFNPSVQNDFADWQKDADIIVGLYRKYGIRMFKIDGLTISSKLGEENLRKLFDRVLEKTDNAVMFNLDATASRRGGYHMLNEYGNVFLENRYTDWGNYYPYHTLRNLWMLAKYVPTERLQIEFLNKWRNAEKYTGDRFAPAAYSFPYIFAVTMAGQPLAWMEASNLPQEAFAIKQLIDSYHKVQHKLHSGTILPIGDEPSGRAWTGFQSILSPSEGFVIVYREDNPAESANVTTWLTEGTKAKFTPVLGNGKSFSAKVGEEGRVKFSLPSANDFALYRYQIEK